MEFSLMVSAILVGAFAGFVALAFLAGRRENTEDLIESGALSDKPLKQCYECLDATGRDRRSTAQCASACGMPV